MNKFSKVQESAELPVRIQIAHSLISFNVTEEERKWWSPEMTIRLENENSETNIYEVIGPNSSMFTLAMFFVILGSVIMLAALMMSLSQIHVGESPYLALAVTFLSGMMIVATFGALAVGRMKAADQVSRLREFVAGIIES